MNDDAIAAATRVLDDFMAAFNARDIAAWQKTFKFPSVRLASNTMVIIDPASHPPGLLDPAAWERPNVIHPGPDKVHFDTRFTRYRKDGSVIGGFDSIYVVTCEAGH